MSHSKPELVIVPSPGIGHFVSTAEFAKRMVDQDDRLSLTVLVMKLPLDNRLHDYIDSLSTSSNTCRIKFVLLPNDNVFTDTNNPDFLTMFIESNITHIRDAVKKLVESNSPRVAGLLLDMFCTSIIDIANEFDLPSYLCFTSSGACLGHMFYLQELVDEEGKDITEFKDDPNAELGVSCLVNPLPAKVLSSAVLTKESVSIFLEHVRRFKKTKGIAVNTFTELEPHAIKTLADDAAYPPLYPIGPIFNLKNDGKMPSTLKNECEIMEWLDGQPNSSVVFLCFGSMGAFNEEQVREIAYALERSGHRFLWSLRKPPSKDKRELASECADFQEILPEGFLDRMAGRGKVIGWAPQVDILAHHAVGGFVSHCGWNSILESLWFGIPMATWPLYAEQQFNAFLLVMELDLGVEIKMDYRNDYCMKTEEVVKAEQIERAIKILMEAESGRRKKAKEISTKGQMALLKGGSSCINLGRFIDDVFNNIP